MAGLTCLRNGLLFKEDNRLSKSIHDRMVTLSVHPTLELNKEPMCENEDVRDGIEWKIWTWAVLIFNVKE